MPGLNNKASRQLRRDTRDIPGARSQHRGIHVNENVDAVERFKKNANAKRADHRDLLVHHQKVNDSLQDIYQRAATLEQDSSSRDDRIEQRWRAFERIGGARPKPKVGFAQHLHTVHAERTEERRRAQIERVTGDIDHSKGSALHNMKDRRVKRFVKRQLDRAHQLKRMGDPTPMKQSGKFDRFSGTLNVFQKTKRQIERTVGHDARQHTVKGGKRRSMWDVDDVDSSLHVVRDASAQMRTGKLRTKHAKKAPRGGGRGAKRR